MPTLQRGEQVMAEKLTKEEFVAYVDEQMGAKRFPWHPVPCDCTYDGCRGWKVGFGRDEAEAFLNADEAVH